MARENLRDVLEDVNGWLRFAEAKNGILITICIAALAANKDLIKDSDCLLISVLKVTFVVAMFSAILTGLKSFWPRLNEESELRKGKEGNAFINPLYFGAIASLTAAEYERLLVNLLKDGEALSDWERAYCQQIKANAAITLAKFWYFKTGAGIAAVGILAFAILLVSSI
jgi:hypothetical protein